jgi:hypothetical protein
MVKYDPLKDRSKECGWTRVEDETPPTEQEQEAWAKYTLWSVVIFCSATMFVFMDKPLW